MLNFSRNLPHHCGVHSLCLKYTSCAKGFSELDTEKIGLSVINILRRAAARHGGRRRFKSNISVSCGASSSIDFMRESSSRFMR